ncbi:MAG TPA: hypothetical protein P5218_08290, partial [Planctomycetota bacterium]|nr:hypothetical protein [Planctomycetota bacterium]
MSESTAAAPGANDGSEPVQPFAGLPTWFRSLALVGILALAGYLLHRELRAIRWSDVAKSVHALPLSAMGISVLFTALNFVVLMAYDWTGLKLVRHNLRLRQVAATSLVAYSFGNSLGVFLGATPVRLRMYTAAGLSTADVLRLVLFIGFGFWMGLFCLGGALFLGHPFAIPSGLPIGWTDSRPLGWTLLALAAMGFGVCALRKEPLRWKRLSIQTPPFAIAAVQALIATFDLMLAAAALFVLLPSDLGVGYFAFAAIYILAVVVALLSHVPGGIGVLELVLVAFLPEASHALVASLLVYRVIYYLLPLALATLSVSGWGLFRLRDEVSEIATQGVTWWRVLGPRIVTAGVFLAGLVLLVSGSLPAAEGRLPQIHHLVPLPLMEVSHFLGSLVGAGLLVVARGLQRRIDTAWIITLGMLVLVPCSRWPRGSTTK